MPNTYTQLCGHVVFTVQNRLSLLSPGWKEEVYQYITGIVSHRGQKLLAINGPGDHVHVALGVKPTIVLSDLARDIKAGSSWLINERGWVRGTFRWQEGFGAFSFGQRDLDKVVRYIMGQEEHHRRKTFREEYIGLLKKFAVEYDERYLFSWVDAVSEEQQAPTGLSR